MNTQIIAFPISQLMLNAHYEFHLQVYNYIEQASPKALHLETIALKYLERINIEEHVIKSDTGSRNINSRDLQNEIDDLYQRITTTVNAFAIAVPSKVLDTFIARVNTHIYLTRQAITANYDRFPPSF